MAQFCTSVSFASLDTVHHAKHSASKATSSRIKCCHMLKHCIFAACTVSDMYYSILMHSAHQVNYELGAWDDLSLKTDKLWVQKLAVL